MAASMQVELSSELQGLVQAAMKNGGYRTPEEVVSAALHFLAEEAADTVSPKAMQRICDEAIADTRPGMSAETLRQRMTDFCNRLDAGEQVDDAA